MALLFCLRCDMRIISKTLERRLIIRYNGLRISLRFSWGNRRFLFDARNA